MATVLVTGTNRGIGLGMVKQLLARGDRVLATCRSIAAASELQQLATGNTQLQLFEMDAALPQSMESFASAVAGEPIDIFINNAGVYGPQNVRFGTADAQTWAEVLQINTIAPLILTQLLIDSLRQGSARKLLYISSKVGSIEDNNGGGGYLYRSSKTALNQVVKSLSIDLSASASDPGFTVAALHPGWVLTDMGGPNALIDVETSVNGLLKVMDSLTIAESGSFINYDGSAIPW